MPFRRVLLIALIALGLLYAPVVPPAAAAASGMAPVPKRTVVATAADIGRFPRAVQVPASAPAPPDPVPLSDTEAGELGASLPRAGAGELVVRVVYPLADVAYILDMYVDRRAGTTAATVFEARRGAAPTALAWGSVRREGDRFVGSAESASGAHTTAAIAAGPLDCDACQAMGGVGGLILGLICSGAGLLCMINAAVFGIGVNVVCTENACPWPGGMRSGFVPNEMSCQFASCNLAVTIYNPPDGTTDSVGSGVIWRYPAVSWGTTKNGYPQSSLQDLDDATLPGVGPGDYYRLAWSHQGSDPNFQQCTTEVEISITVVWSNNTFSSTGFMPNGKLFTQGCPGQHYIVG
jgi:hypothetical protein